MLLHLRSKKLYTYEKGKVEQTKDVLGETAAATEPHDDVTNPLAEPMGKTNLGCYIMIWDL